VVGGSRQVGAEAALDIVLAESDAGAWPLPPWVASAARRCRRAAAAVAGGARAAEARRALARVRRRVESVQRSLLCTPPAADGARGAAAGAAGAVEDAVQLRELARQAAFEARLAAARAALRNALLAKPVCPPCLAACVAREGLRAIPARLAPALRPEPGPSEDAAESGFACGWRDALGAAGRAFATAAGRGGAGGAAGGARVRVAGVWVRGGVLGEPRELARQCTGRVSRDDPFDPDARPAPAPAALLLTSLVLRSGARSVG